MKKTFTDKFSLDDKTAVVTGASGMLGRKHTLALLELGATVVMTDIDIKSLGQAKTELKNSFPNGKIETLVMNVVSEASVFDAHSFIFKNIGRVDILINNAAINPSANSLVGNTRTTRLENFSLERWSNELAVGLTGAY